jgi:hypothetical protein
MSVNSFVWPGTEADPETGYEVTLNRPGAPVLSGKAVGSIALAWGEAGS